MEHPKKAYWLWLVMVLGVASRKVLSFFNMYESVTELYYVLHDPDCRLLSDRERQNVRRVPLEQAEAVMAYCEKNGIGIITWDSDLYPESLRHIDNPPALLFYKGNPGLLQEEMLLTVVGTRRPSAYSMQTSEKLCRALAQCNFILVSGCAVGLDTSAHAAAIAEGRPTISVLGCGVDYDYPKENRELKQRIAGNGLLLTEYFPGTAPLPANFPTRNRILSGISEGVLVMEASRRSGSLITANCACEQGKQVFAVPPSDIFDPRYGGNAQLIREGANPVCDVSDVIYAYYLSYPYRLDDAAFEEICKTQDSQVYERPEPAQKKRRPSGGVVNVRPKEEPVQPAPQEKAPASPGSALTPVQQRILEYLGSGSQNINSLCCLLGISFEETSVLLMEMEMLGHIQNTERDLYALAE